MEIYKQYAELMQASKAIDTQLEEIEAKIVEDMKTREVKSDKQEFGTFTLASRKKVSYSENIKKAEESVKLAKIEEEETGIATIETTEFLTFKG